MSVLIRKIRNITLKRDSTLNGKGGTFENLPSNFKTTKLVANTINDIRQEETSTLNKPISVESPKQIKSLELMQLMLTINKITQMNTEITDSEILDYIYSNDFSEEFIAEYGDVCFADRNNTILSEANVLNDTETRIVQRTRDLHTII